MRTSRSGSVLRESEESAPQPARSAARTTARSRGTVAGLRRLRRAASLGATGWDETSDGTRLASERGLPARVLSGAAHHDDRDGIRRLDDREHRAGLVGYAMPSDLLP